VVPRGGERARRDAGAAASGHELRQNVANTRLRRVLLSKATAVASGVRMTHVKAWGEEDPKRDLSLKASGDTPLSLWIARIGDAALASNEWPKEVRRGLRVRRVEYVATGFKDDPAEKTLATVEKDEKQPCGRERFAAQASFPLPGEYKVRARMTAVAPPDSEHAEPRDVTILSEPLAVTIREALDQLLQYARRLRNRGVTATASSTTTTTGSRIRVRHPAVPRLGVRQQDAAPSQSAFSRCARPPSCHAGEDRRHLPVTEGRGHVERERAASGRRPETGGAVRSDQVPQPQVVRRIDVKITGKSTSARTRRRRSARQVLQGDKAGGRQRESPARLEGPSVTAPVSGSRLDGLRRGAAPAGGALDAARVVKVSSIVGATFAGSRTARRWSEGRRGAGHLHARLAAAPRHRVAARPPIRRGRPAAGRSGTATSW
jgi:hypothetical protein